MTIIDKLRHSIDEAIRNPLGELSSDKESFEHIIADLPDFLTRCAGGAVVEQIQDVIELIDLDYPQLDKWRLATSVESGIKWAIVHMVRRIPIGGVIQADTFAMVFESLVISTHFNWICIEWAQAAQKSDDVATSLAYCEVVDRGMLFERIWEESFDGTRQRDRAIKLFSILCNEKVWLGKGLLISKACANKNTALKRLFPHYHKVPRPSRRFEKTIAYVSRKDAPLKPRFDQKQHERTLKELNAMVRGLRLR